MEVAAGGTVEAGIDVLEVGFHHVEQIVQFPGDLADLAQPLGAGDAHAQTALLGLGKHIAHARERLQRMRDPAVGVPGEGNRQQRCSDIEQGWPWCQSECPASPRIRAT